MLKNQDLAHQLLTMTETLIEASELLHQYTAEHNHDNFRTLSGDMYDMLTAILEAAPPLDEEEDGIHLFLAAGSEQNLKPDLVMRAFTEYIKEESDSVPFHYHRVDVYARKPKEAEDSEDHFKFISLGEWKRS